MTRVIFSTWADRVIDNRGKPPEAQAAPPDFNLPAAFEQNKNVSAFMGWAGFALFDEQASIIGILPCFQCLHGRNLRLAF